MKRMLLAFQFLTIIPVKDTGEVPEQRIGSSTALFPVVGFFEGALMAVFAGLLLKVFPTELTNGLLILLMIIANGGLHLDGLADTFDAIASRGDKEKKLAIMKESAVGPIGVISIVMALLLKYILLNAVFFHSAIKVYFASIILMPVISRWAMVPVAYYCRPARQDGLGRIFIQYTELRALLTATALTILASFLVCFSFSHLELFLFHLIFVLPVLYVFNFIVVWFSNKYFDGMSGDLFGAVHETALLLFLTATVLWLQKFI
jgi:adenosylcobinamide-GDP ribazoletransferase